MSQWANPEVAIGTYLTKKKYWNIPEYFWNKFEKHFQNTWTQIVKKIKRNFGIKSQLLLWKHIIANFLNILEKIIFKKIAPKRKWNVLLENFVKIRKNFNKTLRKFSK